MTLIEAVNHYSAMKARLLEAFDDIDDETLADTLEGCTDFKDLIGAMAEQAERDALMSHLLKERIGELSKRKSRFDARSDAVRKEIQRGMEEAGERKLEYPEYTLSLRAVPPSVLITDENLLPDEFWVTTRKPDRKAVKAALEGGPVTGAMLSNGGQTLSMRKS